ncbi:MAG: C39 family peptidase [Clostridia bacterium]|nr:C39 family peptidase [Clostridia bacterium]
MLLLSLITAVVCFVATQHRNDITTSERLSSSTLSEELPETEKQECGGETDYDDESHTVVNPESAMESVTEAPSPIVGYVNGVPYLSQYPRYPNGCEIVSTVMLLRYLGISITSEEFITQYLKMGPLPTVNGVGPDPSKVFCGDPRWQEAWGCNAPVILDSLSLIPSVDELTVSFSDCKSLDELCHEYIDAGYPVIVWGMLGMRRTTLNQLFLTWQTEAGQAIHYNRNHHCLLLVGYDDENYYYHDPQSYGTYGNGAVAYPKDSSSWAFSLMGNQSIAITP